MIKNYVKGLLPGCVKGGYDFVDVRDCALGIVAAMETAEKANVIF